MGAPGDGDDLLLDCEAEAAEDLIKRLSIYRLRRPIRIGADRSVGVHWSPEGSKGVPDPRLPELGEDLPAALRHRRGGGFRFRVTLEWAWYDAKLLCTIVSPPCGR